MRFRLTVQTIRAGTIVAAALALAACGDFERPGNVAEAQGGADAGAGLASAPAGGTEGVPASGAGQALPEGTEGGADLPPSGLPPEGAEGDAPPDAGAVEDAGIPPQCEDECGDPGVLTCLDGAPATCWIGDDGCLAWLPEAPCPDGGKCVDGQCESPPPACADKCPAEGAADCASNKPMLCEPDPGTGCLAWQPQAACGASERCVNGACVAKTECAVKCVKDEMRCRDLITTERCTIGDDGCPFWNPETACQPTEICDKGACVPDNRTHGQCEVCGAGGACDAAGAVCAKVGADSRCLGPCTTDADCAQYHTCQPVVENGAMLGNFCYPRSGECGVVPKAGFGEACGTAAECVSGICIGTGGGGACSATCKSNRDCPAGATCALSADDADQDGLPENYTGYCVKDVPGGQSDGSPCDPQADQCQSAFSCQPMDDAICRDFVECSEKCAQDDQNCLNACFGQSSAECQKGYQDFATCLQTNNCLDANNNVDETCLRDHCFKSYLDTFYSLNFECGPMCETDADCQGSQLCVSRQYPIESGEAAVKFCQTVPAVTCKPSAGGIEFCDNKDNDCDGATDEDNACSNAAAVTRVDLGTFTLPGGQCGQPIAVEVPNNAVSFVVNVGDFNGAQIGTCGIYDPSGQEVTGKTNIHINDSYSGILMPNTPRLSIKPGKWTIFLGPASNQTVTVSAEAIVKTGTAPTAGELPLNIFLAGVTGITAANAKTDKSFLNLVDRLRGIYQSIGINVSGQFTAYDLSAQEITKFQVIDTFIGRDSEFAEMLAISQRAADANAINIFLIKSFGSDPKAPDLQLAGIAAGIPGPVHLKGTRASGVAIALEWGFGDWRLMTTAHASVWAHEMGHFLGLFHTSERDGKYHDPLDDTPECLPTHDKSKDGFLDYSECAAQDGGNVMFWSGNEAMSFSKDQAFVLHRNPFVVSK